MFCIYCGEKIEEGVKFCPYCGKELIDNFGFDKESDALSRAEWEGRTADEPDMQKQTPGFFKNRSLKFWIAAAAVLLFAVVFVLFKIFSLSDGGTRSKKNSGSEVLLEEEIYDLALLKIEEGDFSSAAEYLEAVSRPSDQDRFDELMAACLLAPEIIEVDVKEYPVVSAALSHKKGSEIGTQCIEVTDNGESCEIVDEDYDESGECSYVAWRLGDYSGNQEHSVEINVKSGEISIPLKTNYTAEFEEPRISFVSADISDFPTISAGF